MNGIRASMETIEDSVARMILYEDDDRVRSFLWDPDDLPDDVQSGDQFKVTFEDDDIESEVVDVSYSEEMTEQRRDELRIPTAENLLLRGASESKIREFLENSGTSDKEGEQTIDEYVDADDLDPESVVSITDSVVEALEEGESTGTDTDLQVLREALNTLEQVSQISPAAVIPHRDLLFELTDLLGDVRNIKSLIVILTNTTIATPAEERDIPRITNTINELANADETRIPTQPTGNSNNNSESPEWEMSAAEQAQFIALREGRQLSAANPQAAEHLLPTFIDKLYDDKLTISEQAAFGCLAILDEYPEIVQSHSEHGVSEILARLRHYHQYDGKISDDLKTQTQAVTEELTKRGVIDTPGSEQESNF